MKDGICLGIMIGAAMGYVACKYRKQAKNIATKTEKIVMDEVKDIKKDIKKTIEG